MCIMEDSFSLIAFFIRFKGSCPLDYSICKKRYGEIGMSVCLLLQVYNRREIVLTSQEESFSLLD